MSICTAIIGLREFKKKEKKKNGMEKMASPKVVFIYYTAWGGGAEAFLICNGEKLTAQL